MTERDDNLTMSEPLVLDAREAAERLGISTRTLFSLTKAGELPAVRIKRRIFYTMDDLRSFIAARREVRHG